MSLRNQDYENRPLTGPGLPHPVVHSGPHLPSWGSDTLVPLSHKSAPENLTQILFFWILFLDTHALRWGPLRDGSWHSSSTSSGPLPLGSPHSSPLLVLVPCLQALHIATAFFSPGTLLRISCNDCIWQSGQLSLASQLWASVSASLGLCSSPLLSLALLLKLRLSPALLPLLI